jgi:heme A synthase
MRWRLALTRSVLLIISLTVVLGVTNLALGAEQFPWTSIFGVPAVALVAAMVSLLASRRRRPQSDACEGSASTLEQEPR